MERGNLYIMIISYFFPISELWFTDLTASTCLTDGNDMALLQSVCAGLV